MPFGSIFGAIVFGILGVVLGLRMFGAEASPVRLMGASLVVLGLALAAGLLMKRTWARWLGVVAGMGLAWSAGTTFVEQGSVFQLTVSMAAIAVAILLAVPATGRPERVVASPAVRPSAASRFFLSAASLAVIGFLCATAWAVALQPAARPSATRVEPSAEARPVEARPAEPRPAGTPASVKWNNFAEGLKQAKQGRKLVVADFYATWCGPCKAMEKHTFHDPRVVSRLQDVVAVRVDAEETTERGGLKGADLALRYSIEVYPTIVVVDGDGREVARNSGLMDPDEFLAWIDAVIEKASTTVARS